MVRIRKKRVLVNPTRPKRKRKPARRRRANPPALAITLGHINPKGGRMKKTYRRRRPVRRHRIARRRNPRAISRPVRGAIDMLKIGSLALGGMVVTRQLPQALLGQRNTGIVGYFANAAAAALSSWAVGKASSPQNGQAVLIGGALYLVERVLSEQFTPLGRALSLSGVGDARAAGTLRGIQPAYFPWPVVHDKQGQPVIPKEIAEAGAQAALAQIPTTAPKPGVAGVGRFASRF